MNETTSIFFYPDDDTVTSSKRRNIDMLLDSFNERKLALVEALAYGIDKSKKVEET